MACPFFYPGEKLNDHGFIVTPRLPLGEARAGECRSASLPYWPDPTMLMKACNLGHGRHYCERFPTSAKADAVRFHVRESTESLIRVQCILENECRPAGHCAIEYSKSDGKFLREHEDSVVQRQVEAFLDSYLARR